MKEKPVDMILYFLSFIINCKVRGTKQMGNYIYLGLKIVLCEYVNKKENVWKIMIKMIDHGI